MKKPDILSPAAAILAAILFEPSTADDPALEKLDFEAFGKDEPLARLIFEMHSSATHSEPFVRMVATRIRNEGWGKYEGTTLDRLEKLASFESLPTETIAQLRSAMDEEFDRDRFKNRLAKAMRAVDEGRLGEAKEIAREAYEFEVHKPTLSFDDYLIAAEEKINSPREGVVHGIPGIEKIFPLLPKGQLTVIAAGTSVGKSLAVGQIARTAILKGGHPVAYASLEDGPLRTAERFLRALAQVNSMAYGAQLTPAERERLTQARLDFPADFVIPIESKSIYDIASVVRQRMPHLLIIDQLSHLEGVDEKDKEERFVYRDYIDIILDRVCRALGIPVVLVHQLSREGSSGEPLNRHLAGSAFVERHTDNIILLHRPEDEETGTLGDEVLIKVSKQRDGAQGRGKALLDTRTYSLIPATGR